MYFAKIQLLIFLLSIIYIIQHYYLKNNKITYIDYYNSCLKYKYTNITIYYSNMFDYGKDLWSYFLINNNVSMCSFIKSMNLFKYENEFYYHRLYSLNSKTCISVHGSFPDLSYYRLVPKNKNDYNNVITHTYEVQNYIYKHQHPLNCKNKKYLIIKGYNSGHGSEIHVLTSYLALALSLNRIAIFDTLYITMKAQGKFCNKEKNWLCFLEQLSNCSLSRLVYLHSVKYTNSNQIEKYLYITGVTKFKSLIPPKVLHIIKNSPIYTKKLLHYWRIQASTYIFRLNRRTNNEVNKIIYKSLNNKLNRGCFNIWIRHGDKYKEMKLLESEDYIPAYNIFKFITNENIPIYLSTDDPNVTHYYDNLKYTKTYYLKMTRNNDYFLSNMRRGDEMTLYFIADIKASLYCNGYSGTRKSNVVRLIDELRSTVGLSANALYFENGNIQFSDTSYEYYEYW